MYTRQNYRRDIVKVERKRMNIITGAMTALITPFKNGKLDTSCYEYLIKRQIEQGIDAVVPVGTTGESATLSHSEHKECIEIAVAVCKGTNVKVIAGAGSNATHEACDIAKHAQNVGAHGILSVAPYYNKPMQDGLYEHYKAIASAVEIPVMLYNVPGRTGVCMKPETIAELFKIDNILSTSASPLFFFKHNGTNAATQNRLFQKFLLSTCFKALL